jgi:TatD DNase family protein
MIDTHCHLNFSSFNPPSDGFLKRVISNAQLAGVEKIIVPGTDIESSKKAVEIAEKYEGVYAAVGLHPHHAYLCMERSNTSFFRTSQVTPICFGVAPVSLFKKSILRVPENIKRATCFDSTLIPLLSSNKVVAIGEVGIDKHPYQKTKYENYHIDSELVELQKQLFIEQIKLAIEYNKSLIIHNREARKEVLEILKDYWDVRLEGRTVFHCCEPDIGTTLGLSLLNFAIKHHIYIGVDGDVTYNKEKQEFVKKIPLDLLVLETDAPFLLPEPLRSQKKYPNEPKNMVLILNFIAALIRINIQKLNNITSENAKKLFGLTPSLPKQKR